MIKLDALAPYLGAAGNTLVNFDENTTGADDLSGQLLIYAGEVIASVQDKADLPPLPDIIAKGTTEHITGAARASLLLASSLLPIAQFQVSGKAATAIRYVNQVLRDLLAYKPISPAPANIKQALG